MIHPPTSAPRRGRLALNLAGSLLAVLLVGQVAAIGWALHKKQSRPENVSASAAGHANPTDAAPPKPSPSDSSADASLASVSSSPTLQSAADAVRASAVSSANAAPADAFPITDERVRFFLGSALASREQGDMKAALTQFRAACDLQPGHPRLLYELASTYESMSLPAKAAPVWDQLSALGESAGPYFKLAQARFEQGDAAPAREVATPLRLGKILERSQQEPAGGEAVTLRIPVQSLDGAQIDPGRVSVVTQFFDELGGDIVETDALTENHRWLSGEFPTWTTNSVEFLDQPYRRPPDEAQGAGDARRYHGYVVKLYYNDHLQDMVAKPAQLANRQIEPGERALQEPAEIPTNRTRPANQLDDSLFPPLPE